MSAYGMVDYYERAREATWCLPATPPWYQNEALWFGAFWGVLAGALLVLGILRIGDVVLERKDRARRAAIEAAKQREAMVRAMRAIAAKGDYLSALRSLQEREDWAAANLVYIMHAADAEFTGNTWAAVDAAMDEAA